MHRAYLDTLLDTLAERGMSADALVDPIPQEITAEALAALLIKARRLTDDPALGLAFGTRINLASHGVLGYALMSCRNGEQLLSALTRFGRLAVPGVAFNRLEDESTVRLAFRLDAPAVDRTLFVELIIATLVVGARALFNRRIPGAEVWLDYPAPAHADAYAVLRVPVRFNRLECALVCDRGFLAMELPSANPLLAEIGNRQCFAMIREMRHRAGAGSEVRALLLRSVGKLPDQAETARRLHMSARTLRRRLEHEGTSFRDIVDEVRFELAKRYLDTGEIPVTEVAALLDYDDPANFRRAFKRWSGMTAQAYMRAG